MVRFSSELLGRLRQDLAALPEVVSSHTSAQFDNNYYHDTLARMHLLALKCGLKRVYYDGVQSKDLRDISDSEERRGSLERYELNILANLEYAAKDIGLTVCWSGSPPVNFGESRVVPLIIMQRHAREAITSTDIWIYNEPSVTEDIRKALNGDLRVGDLLGYPACCVDWMDKMRSGFLERSYRYYIDKNPDSDDDSALEYLRKHVESEDHPGAKEQFEEIDRHIILTWKQYPFVAHQACASCLDNNGSPTALLNREFSEFARALSMELYENIVHDSAALVTGAVKDWYGKKPLF